MSVDDEEYREVSDSDNISFGENNEDTDEEDDEDDYEEDDEEEID